MHDELGLGLNADALRAVNFDRIDGLAREIVEKQLRIVDPPITKKLLVDASERGKENEDVLSIKFVRLNRWVGAVDHDGATNEDIDKCRRFPQKKYVERTDEYIVPLTQPNVDHLLSSWKQGEYQLTPGAQLMFNVYFDGMRASNVHLGERAEFLASGVAPALDDYYHVEGMPPYAHQAVAFSSGRFVEYFGLFMDPGTGKTRVEIDIACDRARRTRRIWAHTNNLRCEYKICAEECCKSNVDPATTQDYIDAGWSPPQFRWLIVAPKTVCRTWERELGKWATLDVNAERLVGSKLQRAGLLATLFADKTSPVLCAIINYDGLEVIEEFLRGPEDYQIWDRVTCDESIAIKNPDTKRAKTVYRIAGGAKSRAVLNGTPISKNILDLYGQFHFLKPGSLGYTSFYQFEDYYGERSYFGGSTGYKKEKLPELQERMARNSFVIKRGQCVDLPPKIYATVEPELGEEQRSAYVQMAEEMIVDLEKVQAGETLDSAEAADHQIQLLVGGGDESKFAIAQIVLVRMLRLAQITSGFMKMKDGSVYHFKEQPKLDALEEHIESLQDDQRIVVWSRFRPEIEAVVERFKDKYGACALMGGIPDKVREARLDAHEHGKHLLGYRVPTRLIVIQPQTGGFGLNELIGSTDVNYLSNEWSLMYREQSEDRTHRIGVKASVLYNDYIVPNTIDQLMWERIQQKRELADLLTNPQNVINALRSQLGAMRLKF